MLWAMSRQSPANEWHPASWQAKKAKQQPNYPDQAALSRAVAQLSTLPPLVTSGEVDLLKKQIASAQRGEKFLLQGGDCAESFGDCRSEIIVNKLKILLQMSIVLLHGFKQPVIRVGRIAGQYAKPRSADTETRGDETLPSYRGDLVNAPGFNLQDRVPDPERLLRGYTRAGLTLNFIRSLVDGGFADLHHPEYWDLDFVSHSPMAQQYSEIAKSIANSLDFLESISGRKVHQSNRIDFFTSHEGLHLHYEQAQTRFIERRRGWYDLTAHLPWIGMRTAELDGAHVEFFRGVKNPVGIKVGAGMDSEWLQELLSVLNPSNEPGRIVLIHRFGAEHIEERLPGLIKAVQATGSLVLWVCDPMHGNTETSSAGPKTRRFENILSEVESAFRVHKACGSRLGGVHIELTGDNVTECTGGAR
ncbi:MAG: 3-deoxy-7-phosphoheptulonate synthase, partial [Gammaproteobacteria bacterium]|nr:3-deoxy-7-phosphoheptulonate synthase [Gammaproteobacteria bacterium]